MQIKEIIQKILGEPNFTKTANEWRYGNHGSLKINTETDTWFNHESGQGGGVKDLLLHYYPNLTYREAMQELGLSNVQQPTTPPQINEKYDYLDQNGKLSFQVLRLIPKSFRQRAPAPDGGWIPSVKGVTPIPYQLPLIVKNPDKPIFIVEGEKDVQALLGLGFIATTNAGGANNWKQELNKWFEGRNVIIIPDKDDAGKKHADTVIHNLRPLASAIKLIELPGSEKDISDWISAGGTSQNLKQIIANTQPLEGPKAPLRFLSLLDLKDLPPPTWLVQNIISENTFAVMYGEPGCGKTFLALGMGLSVANGIPWVDEFDVNNKGCVIYVAGEGVGGLAKRTMAWMMHHRQKANAPFIIIPSAVDLIDPNAVEELKQTIKIAVKDAPVKLMVFDTLARCMSGDENSSQDMGNAVRAIDYLKEEFNTTVLAIHHSGKDSARGHRGSSALLGAVDTSIKVKKYEDYAEFTVEKQKDAEAEETVGLKVTVVQLQDEQTSLVYTKSDKRMQSKVSALKGNESIAYNALLDAVRDSGWKPRTTQDLKNYPGAVLIAPLETWKEHARKNGLESLGRDKDSDRKLFDRIKLKLIDKKLIGIYDNNAWIIPEKKD